MAAQRQDLIWVPSWPEVWSSLIVVFYFAVICWVLEATRFHMPEPPQPIGMEVLS